MKVAIGFLLGITAAYIIGWTVDDWERRYREARLRLSPDPVDRIIYGGEVTIDDPWIDSVDVDPNAFEQDTLRVRSRRWFGL